MHESAHTHATVVSVRLLKNVCGINDNNNNNQAPPAKEKEITTEKQMKKSSRTLGVHVQTRGENEEEKSKKPRSKFTCYEQLFNIFNYSWVENDEKRILDVLLSLFSLSVFGGDWAAR